MRLTCKSEEIGRLCGLNKDEIDARGIVPRPEAGLGHKPTAVSASETELDLVSTFFRLFISYYILYVSH